MKTTCLRSGECGQYCALLNNLSGETQDGRNCTWPERVDGADFSQTANPELAQEAARGLLRVLTLGGQVRETLNEPGSELNVASRALYDIETAQLNLWQSYVKAARQDRAITDVEVAHFTGVLGDALESGRDSMANAGVGPEAMTLAQAIYDRRTLEDYGLLLDENIVRTVTEMCAAAASGTPILAIGDKGIAKTQAARYVSATFAPDGKPRFISGDGSMMKDEFIGKMTLTEQNGATVTTFKKGLLVECMEQGIPLVMDEINLIDPAIAMRLQDILLRKPGDVISLQEDGGEQIVIKRGFCVIATANEASSRYQSRAVLDPAFRDRFLVMPIEYPDGDTPILYTNNRPQSLARLAYAFVVSRDGIASSRVAPRDAMWLASVAHASQQLYSRPAKEVDARTLGGAVAGIVDDTEPRMSDCITPRKMVEILRKVDAGTNPYAVAAGVRGMAVQVIAGMRSHQDRQTMFEILRLMHDDLSNPLDERALKAQLRI